MDLKSKLSTGLLRGEGGVAGPLSSKRLQKKVIFFLTPSLMDIHFCFVVLSMIMMNMGNIMINHDFFLYGDNHKACEDQRYNDYISSIHIA